jgi:hypothetical protein
VPSVWTESQPFGRCTLPSAYQDDRKKSKRQTYLVPGFAELKHATGAKRFRTMISTKRPVGIPFKVERVEISALEFVDFHVTPGGSRRRHKSLSDQKQESKEFNQMQPSTRFSLFQPWIGGVRVVESHLEFVLPAFGNAEQHSSTGLCQFSAIPHFHSLPSSSCVSHLQLMHRFLLHRLSQFNPRSLKRTLFHCVQPALNPPHYERLLRLSSAALSLRASGEYPTMGY